jgi:hypothetical protein
MDFVVVRTKINKKKIVIVFSYAWALFSAKFKMAKKFNMAEIFCKERT